MASTDQNGDVALDSGAFDQLRNAEAKKLLDTIDNLRELQVGRCVQLPQIIVVGAQSSGKSSVLEAISHVRFPVDGRVCTRFATELILRRTANQTVKVSIQLADKQGEDGTATPFQTGSGFSQDELPRLISQAKERMGIRGGSKEFSDDVLRVEITGPDVYPLTLVDLPGLYQGSTSEQSKEGAEFVGRLVKRYMSEKNSIMLAIVSANYNLAHQGVLDATQEHDPTRERTLGVITKPDLAGVADQQHFIQLARNQEDAHKLSLGWHVLRNRAEDDAEQELASEERDAQEVRFFQDGPWSSVPEPSRGVKNLRKKLSEVLLEHIQKTLPGLVGDIETKLRAGTEELEQLGKSRSTPREMRSYLIGVAGQFERLARDAVDGRYGDPFFGGLHDDARKLRALVRNLNRAFDVTLARKGGKYRFDWYGDGDQASSDDNDDEDDPAYLRPFIAEYSFEPPEPKSEQEIKDDLEKSASANQGREFPGAPNSALAMRLFEMQAEPWKEIAQFHIKKVLDVTKAVIEQLLVCIVGQNHRTIQGLLRNCVDPFFEAKEEMLREKLKELLRPYVSGHGMPLETEFHKRTLKRTLGRLAERLADRLQGEFPEAFGVLPTTGLSKRNIVRSVTSAEDWRNSRFGTEGIIDMTMVYYEMSLGTFTDNVINLAIEGCLVVDIPSILTTVAVDEMSDETVNEVASESDDIQATRRVLQDQVRVLRRGLQECKQHRLRGIGPSALRRTAADDQISVGLPPRSRPSGLSQSAAAADPPSTSAKRHVVVRLPTSNPPSPPRPSEPSQPSSVTRAPTSVLATDQIENATGSGGLTSFANPFRFVGASTQKSPEKSANAPVNFKPTEAAGPETTDPLVARADVSAVNGVQPKFGTVTSPFTISQLKPRSEIFGPGAQPSTTSSAFASPQPKGFAAPSSTTSSAFASPQPKASPNPFASGTQLSATPSPFATFSQPNDTPSRTSSHQPKPSLSSSQTLQYTPFGASGQSVTNDSFSGTS